MTEWLKSLNLGGLESLDLASAGSAVERLVRDPGSNLGASLVLLSIVILVVLIFIIAIIATVTSLGLGQRDSRELEALREYLALLEAEEGAEAPTSEGPKAAAPEPVAAEAAAATPPRAAERSARVRVGPRSRVVWMLWTAIVVVVVWVALGATTSTPDVCASCHVTTAHSTAASNGVTDPHGRVSCVRCHEPSGLAGSLTVELPGRLQHYVSGVMNWGQAKAYGMVMSSACASCHQPGIASTTTDEVRGVRMSHNGPLAAGADCRDCHLVSTGIVSSLTAGMSRCLPCHDGKRQSAECSMCHTKDISIATRSHIDPAKLKGSKLIDTPNCGACHDMAKSCDPCHGGIRMPHTPVFKWWGHARKGVEDIWFNNAKACPRCHTPTRNPCTKCHAFLPTPGHGISWATEHQGATSGAACDACHTKLRWNSRRNFCDLCHGKVRVNQ